MGQSRRRKISTTEDLKSIFISGGAQEIGLAVAQKFLAEGWLVGVYAIHETSFSHLNLRSGFLDVTDPTSWDETLAEFASHTGGAIDVVDYNAGIIISGPLQEAPEGGVEKLICVNVGRVTLGARAAHKYLARTPGAHLVNISSASKFYVAGLTEALNLEWHVDDIRVVDVSPLWTKTELASDMNAKSVKSLGVRLTPEQVADAVGKPLIPRLGGRGQKCTTAWRWRTKCCMWRAR